MGKCISFSLPFDVRAVGDMAGAERSSMIAGLSEKISVACGERLLELEGIESMKISERIEQGLVTWWSFRDIKKRVAVWCELGRAAGATAEELESGRGLSCGEIGEAVVAGLRGIVIEDEGEIVGLRVEKVRRPKKAGSLIWIDVTEEEADEWDPEEY